MMAEIYKTTFGRCRDCGEWSCWIMGLGFCLDCWQRFSERDHLRRMSRWPTPAMLTTKLKGDDMTDQSPKTSHWSDNPDWPVEDWQYEVANGDTRLGYSEWVDHNLESPQAGSN